MLRSDRVIRVRSNCVALQRSGRQQRESSGYFPQYELTGDVFATIYAFNRYAELSQNLCGLAVLSAAQWYLWRHPPTCSK
jgi:hypothetical protein